MNAELWNLFWTTGMPEAPHPAQIFCSPRRRELMKGSAMPEVKAGP